MLFALATPVAFAGLLAGFVVAVTVHGLAQAVAGGRLGDRQPRLAGRTRADPRRHLDAFGAVAVALSGLGWGRPVELDSRRLRSRARFVTAVAAGPLAVLVVGVAVLAAYAASTPQGPLVLRVLAPATVLRGQKGLPALDSLLVSFGMAHLAVGLLELVPLPPLDGALVLFAMAPRTLGWQRAHHYLAEQNFGVGALLVLLLIPLAGQLPLLLFLLDLVAGPLGRAVGLLLGG